MAKKVKDRVDLDTKLRFNDIFMRELGLDLTEEDYLFDFATETVFQIKEKYIKYCEAEYPILRTNEIECNLIENARLAETIVLPFLNRYCDRKQWLFQSIAQIPIDGSTRGYVAMTYAQDGETKTFTSDEFTNESVRLFNLICKLKKTTHMYRFEDFDILIGGKK